jgi:hypothetical protein
MYKKSLPFTYFLANSSQIIKNLEDQLNYLKLQRFICSDKELPELEKKISNVQKNIKFNQSLQY